MKPSFAYVHLLISPLFSMPQQSTSNLDPLTIATAPPPNETREERANRLEREEEARRISLEIDEQLKVDGAALKKTRNVRLLLLGQSESGKTTMLKNFQRTLARKTWEQDRVAWRVVVQLNLVRSINLIRDTMTRKLSDNQQNNPSLRITDVHHLLSLRLAQLKQVEEQLCLRLGASSYEESPLLAPKSSTKATSPSPNTLRGSRARSGELFVKNHSSWKSSPQILRSESHISPDEDEMMTVIAGCRDDMKALWGDPVSRQLIENRDLRLQESAEFFLNGIDRIAVPGYTPSDDDVIRARLRTMGVQEYKLDLDDDAADWYIYDVGGTHGQRAKWMPYFDRSDAIIFLAPVSAFNECLAENPNLNRLEDSFLLWKSICSSPLLSEVTLIIFLNKIDILKRKLSAGTKVNQYLPSYGNRPNELEHVIKYLREQFKQVLIQHSPSRRPFYGYPTVAVDTEATTITIKAVRDGILRESLKKMDMI